MGLLALLLALLLLDAGRFTAGREGAIQRGHALARAAGLTDPALFTEARYARNASLADTH